MAYVIGATKYVEINTECPLVIRLSSEALGLNNWSLSMFNQDSLEIVPVSQFVAQEIGEFVPRTVVNGDHPYGTSKIVVVDSSSMAIGMHIRMDNMTFKILAVEPANHIITIDKVLPRSVAHDVQIKEVIYPNYLGMYRFEFVPTLLGNFLVSIFDESGTVNPIEDDITVLATLKSANGSGRLSAYGRTDM